MSPSIDETRLLMADAGAHACMLTKSRPTDSRPSNSKRRPRARALSEPFRGRPILSEPHAVPPEVVDGIQTRPSFEHRQR